MVTVGVLLAGGLSRRYGSPKAFAEVDGKAFYEWTYSALAAASDQVVIVTRPELLDRFPYGCDVVTDLPEVAGHGPLAGIYTAMQVRPADRYIVLPCDMPFIRSTETEKLLQAAGQQVSVTAVKTPEQSIPLFSVWNSDVRYVLEEELLQGQLSVMKFLEQLPTDWISSEKIHADERIFCNINRLDDQRKGGRQ